MGNKVNAGTQIAAATMFTFKIGTKRLPWIEQTLHRNFFDLPVMSASDCVVDVGCGPGELLVEAYIRGARILVGIEPSLENMTLAKRNTGDMEKQSARMSRGFFRAAVHSPNLRTMSFPESYNTSSTADVWSLVDVLKFARRCHNKTTLEGPVIRVLRLNCNGGEWPALYMAPDEFYQQVQMIIIHVHEDKPYPGYVCTLSSLKDFLMGQGYLIQEEKYAGRHLVLRVER